MMAEMARAAELQIAKKSEEDDGRPRNGPRSTGVSVQLAELDGDDGATAGNGQKQLEGEAPATRAPLKRSNIE